MNEKQSYYMVIPAEVWESNLTAKAMILYGHISVLASKEKYCWANNQYFIKTMKISEATGYINVRFPLKRDAKIHF
jgi:hypothetical protein